MTKDELIVFTQERLRVIANISVPPRLNDEHPPASEKLEMAHRLGRISAITNDLGAALETEKSPPGLGVTRT